MTDEDELELRESRPLIGSELDELEREEFFRLKKVQAKKKEKVAEEDALRAERKAAGGTEAVSMMDEADDGDLLF